LRPELAEPVLLLLALVPERALTRAAEPESAVEQPIYRAKRVRGFERKLFFVHQKM